MWLHQGTYHVPLPKEGHLGILPQRGAEATPCEWISQLEVCQFLIASPQVIYPIGFNGYDEPFITSLPEPLASCISLTAGEPVYLEIDIALPMVGARPEDTTSWQGFHHHNSQSLQVHPTKIRRRGQHDPGGKRSLIPSDTRNVWPQVQKLNSKEASPSGCPYASLSPAKGTTSSSRYFISGKHRDGRSIPRGNPHQHLSYHSDL